MTSWVNGIEAITLFHDDLQEARAFYEKVFGLPVVHEDPDSVVFRFGGTLVNLLDRRAAGDLVAPGLAGARPDGYRAQLTLGVEDVDEVCRILSERGVVLLNGPLDRPWGVRTASFEDPAGHLWEIAH